MVHRNGKDFVGDFVFKAYREAGSVAGGVIVRIKGFIQDSKGANLVNFGRFIDKSLFDGIRANVTRCHVGIGARRSGGIESRDEINHRCIGYDARMFVFDFNQTDHVCFHTQNSGNDFIALAGKLFRCIRASTFHIASRTTNFSSVIDSDKVVEHIQAGNADFAFHKGWRGRTFVECCVCSCANWLDFILTEVVIHHASEPSYRISTAEIVFFGELSAIRMAQVRWILSAKCVINLNHIKLISRFGSDGVRAWFI